LASQQRIPLYVLIKTYKFSNETEMNNFKLNTCRNFKGIPSKDDQEGHYQVDMQFDLLPCNFISLLITELELMPPTGVPVYLRELKRDEFY
jgi:translation initiation factor 2B subunit (eIF-2B alpha/beta/delta family)